MAGFHITDAERELGILHVHSDCYATTDGDWLWVVSHASGWSASGRASTAMRAQGAAERAVREAIEQAGEPYPDLITRMTRVRQ